MLLSLHVKNLALIEEEEIEFTDGLNILTGETGAGKSIIIGSVNLALGAKADRSIIRDGAEYALCELVFTADTKEQEDKLREMDIPSEDDGTVLIKRKIMPLRSSQTVNGENVTTHQLRNIASLLIDIYGQRENQTLLSRGRQLGVLDDYAGKSALEMKREVGAHYRDLESLREQWEENALDENSRKRELELLDYEINEIESAALADNEDDLLEKKYRKMAATDKIRAAVATASESVDGEDGASEGIARACRELSAVAGSDETLDGIAAQLSEVDGLLSDYSRAIGDYADALMFDPDEFRETEERLDLINHLKEKYGDTIAEIREAEETRSAKRDTLLDYETGRRALSVRIDEERAQYQDCCMKLSKIRKKAATEFAAKMREALLELNFAHVDFNVDIRTNEENGDSTGMDKVVFMISMNPGEAPKPLDEIASGGELSRIMLGLKTVFAGKDGIHTFIFDEIDTGISGQTAWKVAEKLGRLSADHQVIAITHLPQIAAMADTHFRISKDSEGGRTFTHIEKLSGDESVEELGRLLGGASVTEATMTNAREMREMAAKTRKKNNGAGS